MNSSYEMLEGIGVSMAIAILRMNHADEREVEWGIVVGHPGGRGGPIARELGCGEVEERVRLGVRVRVDGGRGGDGGAAAGARARARRRPSATIARRHSCRPV